VDAASFDFSMACDSLPWSPCSQTGGTWFEQVTCNVGGKLTRPLGLESCDQEPEVQLEWLDELLVVFLMESIMRPTLCNVFINWMMRWNAPLVSLQAKLWGVADKLGDRAAILRDLKRLEKQAGRNLVKFNKLLSMQSLAPRTD